MGMLDSVFVKCPKCGKLIEFQSKAGSCELRNYISTNVPTTIAEDLDGESTKCICGTTITLHDPEPNRRVSLIVHTDIDKEWD